MIFCTFGGRNLGVVEAGGEVRGGVRVRNIGLTDRLSASDRVCYKGRPGPVERCSEVTGRVWGGGEGEVGRRGGGERASERWRYQSSGCVMGTCMHHMRGGMGKGGDVYQTGGATEWGGGGVVIFCTFGEEESGSGRGSTGRSAGAQYRPHR